jgi:hypothetical protein
VLGLSEMFLAHGLEFEIKTWIGITHRVLELGRKTSVFIGLLFHIEPRV